MATFNMNNQIVTYQYNADTINFGGVENLNELRLELDILRNEIQRAIEAKALEGESAIGAEKHVKDAIQVAAEDTPDKTKLVAHLSSARDLIANVDGLVAACSAAISTIGRLF